MEELYRLEDIPRLKSLVCSFKERTFYCCDNTPGETAPAPVSVISEDPTFSPSWLPDVVTRTFAPYPKVANFQLSAGATVAA